MRAWRFHRVGQPPTIEDVPTPSYAPDEVLIDVRAAGLCHTDVGYLEGAMTPWAPMPMTLGHEVAGVVHSVGADVTKVAVGDRVAIYAVGDGRSSTELTLLGETPRNLGTGRDGGYAEQTVAREFEVVPIPDGLGFVQAAAACDAGMTSHHAVVNVGQVGRGTRVGIVGLGGVGLTGAKIAVAMGAEVYAAEFRRDVHPVGRDAGVLEVVESASELAQFDLDVIIDFAGFGTTTAAALEAVRPRGRVVQVGLGVPDATIPVQQLVLKPTSLLGSMAGTPDDVRGVMELMLSAGLEITATTIAFADIGHGLERLARGEVVGRLVAELP